MSFELPRSRLALVSLLAILALGAFVAFQFQLPVEVPPSTPPHFEEFVTAFQVGVAALDADLPQVAEEKLTQAVKLIPQEPAGWANRGLLYLRTGRLPEAESDLQNAVRLVPNDPEVQKLLGLLKQRQGRFGDAAAHLRRAIEQDRDDVQAIYLLAKVVDQEQLPDSDIEYQRLMEQILTLRPDNLRVLVDRLRVAVRRADSAAVTDTVKQFERLAPSWHERARTGLENLKPILSGPLGPQTVPRLLPMSNLLIAERTFARNAAEVSPPEALAGHSIQEFLALPVVRPNPAPADNQLGFTAENPSTLPEGRWDVVLPVWLSGEGAPVVFVANAQEVRRSDNDSTLPALGTAPAGLIALDWNNDARSDLLLFGAKGLRFYQQQDDGSFQDIGLGTKLEVEVTQGDIHSALAADVDLDGDLDVILSRSTGPLWWLRNNLDGTFLHQPVFSPLEGPQSMTWADFDHDGAPDAALLDADGRLHIFANERSGQFRLGPTPLPDHRLRAIAAADVDDDGVIDLVCLRDNGSLVSYSDRDKHASLEVAELGQWKSFNVEDSLPIALFIADFDNNGALDLLASGPSQTGLWLRQENREFQSPTAKLPAGLLAAVDLRNAGRLDLLGLDKDGQPFHLRNFGQRDYHWQTIRPQAAGGKIEGDNRINSFGIDGEIEVRTGTQVVKQPIRTPSVHFGLGLRSQADIVRIQWPNGTFQYEFNPPVDQSVVATQRLKGSCPFLYAWNGTRFDFVTDFMWSSPLGMYINASDKGGFQQTTDWVKIPGEQLVPRDGAYELRVNANLWETHFFDHVSLMVVDHPPNTELFVDERFCLEPTPPTWHLMEPPQRIARAIDHLGHDATSEVLATDGVHLDRSGRGQYQGVTNDHWVEVELGDDVPSDGPVWLVARGWIHPTDSSVNFAIEQGTHVQPRMLFLEIPDEHGGWKNVRDLGFPAGKNKTILVRLDNLEQGNVPHRLRLRTNLEIYWDSIQIAHGSDDALAQQTLLLPNQCDLQFRGIVAMTQANRSSPELPHYDEVVSRGQHWRDLIGYHTRYGDIRELTNQVDDRYAIICAGDEIVLRFTAPAAPPAGWKRDFVWVADGWVKDGDYNTHFGKTVLPLPAHDMSRYDVPPRELEDDPVYRRYPGDWETYHTRYVTPHLYERGLRPPRLTGKTNVGSQP